MSNEFCKDSSSDNVYKGKEVKGAIMDAGRTRRMLQCSTTFSFPPPNHKGKINFYLLFILADYKPICTLYVIALNGLCQLAYSAYTCYLSGLKSLMCVSSVKVSILESNRPYSKYWFHQYLRLIISPVWILIKRNNMASLHWVLSFVFLLWMCHILPF